MTLLAAVLDRLGSVYGAAVEEALAVAERLLAPAGPIPRLAVARLLARAMRNGSWPRLPRETRALLLAAAHTPVRVYRSPRLLALLRHVWLLVELATMRGRAVVAALTHLLANRATVLTVVRKSLDRLIVMGLQALNNPLLSRINAAIHAVI